MLHPNTLKKISVFSKYFVITYEILIPAFLAWKVFDASLIKSIIFSIIVKIIFSAILIFIKIFAHAAFRFSLRKGLDSLGYCEGCGNIRDRRFCESKDMILCDNCFPTE